MDRAVRTASKTMPCRMARWAAAMLAGAVLAIAAIGGTAPSAFAAGGADARYSYETDDAGTYLASGSGEGDVWNYPQTPNANLAEAGSTVQLDDEGFVIVPDSSTGREAAFLKKSAADVPGSPGLFGMTLDIEGNQIEHPVDVVLVVDFSSTMSGTKLENALAGVRDFLEAVDEPLSAGRIRVAAVAYNRETYAMPDFSTDANEVLGFLGNTAKSGTGTFMQKGLYAAQNLFRNSGRADASHLLVHVGDGSANCAYLPADDAVAHPNDGRIVAMGGYAAETYYTDFQTQNARYYSSISTSDPNAVPTDDKQMLSNYTLGTALDLKEDGIEVFSIGVDPTMRGMYTDYNIASNGETHYVAIDADLVGLSEALAGIASHISETVSDGAVVDPMGKDVLLQQGEAGFGPDDYTLTGYRRSSDGTWIEAPELVSSITVSAPDDRIELKGLRLGANERAVLTYHVRLDTEAADFEPDAWYLANGSTTLDRLGDGETANFPVPSIKAPSLTLSIAKAWDDTVQVGGAMGVEADYSSLRPDAVGYVIVRQHVVSPDAWTRSEAMQLTQRDGWKADVAAVTPRGGQDPVRLPAYNSAGEDFGYAVAEVDVPDGYVSETVGSGATLTMTNRLRTAAFSFKKADLDGNPLAGAQFALYDADGALLRGPVASAQDGTVSFSSLPAGAYAVREVEAPAGYVLSEVELAITVAPDEDGALRADVARSDGASWDGTLRNVPAEPGGADPEPPGSQVSGGGSGESGAKLASTGDPVPAPFAALLALGALGAAAGARLRRTRPGAARR